MTRWSGRNGRSILFHGDVRRWAAVVSGIQKVSATVSLPENPIDNLVASLVLAGLAFLITLLVGKPFIETLRLRKTAMGVPGRTPTMGGTLVVGSALLVSAVFNLGGRSTSLLPMGVLVGTAALGALGDWRALHDRPPILVPRQISLFLLGFGLVAALVLSLPSPWGLDFRTMFIPVIDRNYNIGFLIVPLATLAIAGLAQGSALTDGLDFLAAGQALLGFLAYGVIAFVQGQLGVVTFCFVMTGSILGFIWFNAYPAQIFLGESGALSFGATLAIVAFLTGQWLVLPVIGFVYLLEALSVVLQVAYYRRTARTTGTGKRLFRMAPLHHHFELTPPKPDRPKETLSEMQISIRFWIVGAICAMLGVAIALS
jgi:phospho-N-acetylmuramoyl-pentapeptide-transferase